ncbi:cupin domain-containing protein [Flavobacteriaceae bacterium F89]|uniref:glucose-6-phosphate isomerase n=1 Tax=Cerina litoralis TaxID=2874477 RepID=A0AAE3JUG1_9FLAO|nr:glucose-6-phosphate isomerase family protein [Cerina litoralis]MCG2462362.1 cupin domain-containing protein [Cerina litoralis]
MDFKYGNPTPEIVFDAKNLSGKPIEKIERKIMDLNMIFKDKGASETMDQNQIVYEVDCYFPVENDTEGGLFFGITRIKPGKVGDEYFMTKGHFHSNRDRGEFYWGLEGEGQLLLMDEKRRARTEVIKKGSVHYIPGYIAHRVVNTGDTELSFGACWPSDAGHDYASIEEKGFSIRIVQKNGEQHIIKE